MTVYKYYLKSLSRMGIFILINLGIFGIIAFLSLSRIEQSGTEGFLREKISIAISEEARNERLGGFLDNNKNLISIKSIENEEKIARELVYLDVVDIAYIKSAESSRYKAILSPLNPKGYMSKLKAANYLNFLEITKKDGEYNYEIANEINKKNIEPKIVSDKKSGVSRIRIWYKYAYNFLAHPLMGIIIIVFSVSVNNFINIKNEDRMNISGLKLSKIKLNLFMAQILATIGIVIIFFFMMVLMTGYRGEVHYLALFINALTFATSILAFSNLVCAISKNNNFVSAVGNCANLFFSFISGVFIPVEYLPKYLYNISKFFPAHYYAKANELTVDAIGSEYVFYIGVQLLFAACFFLAGLFISHRKRISTL